MIGRRPRRPHSAVTDGDSPPAEAPARVLWVTPGALEERGGMGQVSRIAVAALRAAPSGATPEVIVIDPRGTGGKWQSLARLPLALALVARHRARGPAILHVHIAARGSTWRKLPFVWLGRLTGTPVVLQLHAGLYPAWFASLPRPLRALVRRTFGAADRVVALTDAWARFAQTELGVDASRTVVLHNRVPGPTVPPDRRDREQREILFLGKLVANKGVPELLEALASIEAATPWHATLGGEGDLEALRQRARELGIADRVSFPGWIDGPQVAGLLEASDLLALPSHWEALPMSVLEAMAYGLAVVCTPVGALPDILEDGVSARFVPIGDAPALAAALSDLLDDPAQIRALGTAAHAAWAERFDASAYAADLVALYAPLSGSTARS